MKTVLLLRHAKSSWDNASLADHERPLSKRGRRDAPRVGRLLMREGLVPDRILSSTAKRARLTAEAVADECDFEGTIDFTRKLYAAGPENYVEALRTLPDEAQRILVVGHNPGLEELLALWTQADEPMPTAALAQISLPIHAWRELSEETEGELVDLWQPRSLPD